MCGITAIAKLDESDYQLSDIIKQMNNTLKHRGPDDEGYVLFNENKQVCCGGTDTMADSWNTGFEFSPESRIENIEESYQFALGHRRLSVIDLSAAGHQPMCFNNTWIILNGEIYNYIELRKELEQLNYSFFSNSDTEVLLKAYNEWGKDCLQKLNGMWSFIIYDRNKQIIFGSRDRFGVKPLYYYKDKRFIAFASEQKALLTIPENNIDIHEEAVFDYLFHNQIEQNPEGFFKNIFELQPAHSFTFNFNTNSLLTEKYYNLPFTGKLGTFSQNTFNTHVSNTNSLITEAIRKRLRSDIPVGFCLSGGIDSSSIVCMAALLINNENKNSDNLKVFTAINENIESNEEKWAAKVAESTSAQWYKSNCDAEDLKKELGNIIYFQDIPLSSTSTYAQYKVMQLAANNGIRILVDGQGGDELFAGYSQFFFAYYTELLRKFHLGTFISEIRNAGKSPLSLSVFLKSAVKSSFDILLFNSMRSGILKKQKKESKYFKKEFMANLKKHRFSNDFKITGTNKLLHHFFTGGFLKNLLRWEDRCSMAFSVESRTPFSDDIHLIEYIFNISAKYKIRKGWSKSLLRNAMTNIIPDDIKNRTDKMGFETPQQLWLKEMNHFMKEKIMELKDSDSFIQSSKLLEDWDSIFNSKNSKMQDFVWRYVNYLIWKDLFFKEASRES